MTNPANPALGIRAFGDDPAAVARHGAAFVRGLQGAGVVAYFAKAGRCGIAVISVPTPLREGNPDLSYIEDAAASLVRKADGLAPLRSRMR